MKIPKQITLIRLFIRFVDFTALLFDTRSKKALDSQDVIQASLRTVARNAIANRVCGAFFLLLAAGLLLFMGGAACVSLIVNHPAALAAFYGLSIVTLFFLFLTTLLIPLFPLLSKERIALLIEHRCPSLNNALISSIQLDGKTPSFKTKGTEPQKQRDEYSAHLIALLVADTEDKLKRLNMRQVVEKGFSRLGAAALVASVVIFTIVCISKPGYFYKNVPTLFSCLSGRKDAGEMLAADVPIIGDIVISYRFPLYSELPQKAVYNTNGDLTAIKGSEARISAVSDRTLTAAGMIVNNATKIPLTIENGRMMKGVFLMLEGGTYTFETTDANGRTCLDAFPHKIEIVQDLFPEISLTFPTKDSVVNEKTTVEIRYAAKDDFGIGDISLVFERGIETKSKTIYTSGKKQVQYSGSYAWSLTELGLQSDDKISYHLEVKDNDTISGPKIGRSKTYYLAVFNSKKKRQELVQLQEELLRETLYLLSDDVTKRLDDAQCASKDYLLMLQDGVQGRIEKIIGLFTDVLVGMQEDTEANYSIYYSLENLKDTFRDATSKRRNTVLQSVQNVRDNTLPVTVLSGLQRALDEEVTVVENTIIFLNELIQKQKLEDVMDTGKKLIQSQNDVAKLLDKMRNDGDANMKEKTLAELKRIEETIRQMMEKLMKMAEGEHLDEFLNEDALKDLEENNVMKDLNAMKDAFNKGDLEAALESAQKLLSSLQGMMDKMKGAAQRHTDVSFSDMLNKTNQVLDKIAELENRERELTENTEKLKKAIQKRASESMTEDLKSFFERQGKRIESIKKDISDTRELLAKNGLLQEYLQVNRDLKGITEERDAIASRLGESFGDEEGMKSFQEESNKIGELSRKNAELNRRINKEPMMRDFLSLSRELPQTEETLSHLDEMLKSWEAKESLTLAKELQPNLSRWNSRMQETLELKKRGEKVPPSGKDTEIPDKVKNASELNRQIVKDLEAMMQSFEEQRVAALNEEEMNAMNKDAEEQQEIQEDTEELAEKTDELSKQNPFMDEKAEKQLDMASKSMGGAKGKLSNKDVQGAVMDERESMYRLAEAKKSMEMARERIAKGMMGSGIPMPTPGAFPGQMGEGQSGASTEKVEIPSEEAYKVPKEFRQDILDALKEGLPEKYKDLNKDYYQRLVD